MILLLLACADEAPHSADSLPAECEGAPVVNWDNFGAAFTTESCRGCHSASSLSRVGAPEDVNFDDAAAVWDLRERVLERAGAEPPTMPPEGGTTADDRQKLRWWLLCAEPGT